MDGQQFNMYEIIYMVGIKHFTIIIQQSDTNVILIFFAF